MSHELRTPLNAVLGFTDLIDIRLSAGKMEADKLREYVGDIRIAGRRLLDMVNSILDLTKITSDTIDVAPTSTTARDMVDQSMQLVSGMAARQEAGRTQWRQPRDREYPRIGDDGAHQVAARKRGVS